MLYTGPYASWSHGGVHGHYLILVVRGNLECSYTDSPGQDTSPSRVPSQQCRSSFMSRLCQIGLTKLPKLWKWTITGVGRQSPRVHIHVTIYFSCECLAHAWCHFINTSVSACLRLPRENITAFDWAVLRRLSLLFQEHIINVLLKSGKKEPDGLARLVLPHWSL